MLHRSVDWEFINKVMNDPSVFPMISHGTTGPIDVRSQVEDPKNYLLINEHGGFLFLDKGSQIYDVHTNFLPEGRGKGAFYAALEALKYMFTKTPCEIVITQIWDQHTSALQMADNLRFDKIAESKLFGRDTMIHYALTRKKFECQS